MCEESARTHTRTHTHIHIHTHACSTACVRRVIARTHTHIHTHINTHTPAYTQRPIDLGADICMTSGTKFIGGHGDVTLGVLSVKGPELAKRLYFMLVGAD